MDKNKRFSPSNWAILALLIMSFLCLGIYFMVVDIKILKSVVDKKDVNLNKTLSEISWHSSEFVNQTSPHLNVSVTSNLNGNQFDNGFLRGESEEERKEDGEEEYEENDSGLVVQFDYVDLSSEDLPSDGQFIENVLPPNASNARETRIILKNDDSGKKIFLKTSTVIQNFRDGVPEVDGWNATRGRDDTALEAKETTTPKAFVYSPTIPQATPGKINLDTTTTKYNQSEDSGCFSTKLDFCEGILPYDVVRLPNIPGVRRYGDLNAIIPYFRMIVDSGCSPRAREFICSVLEPECRPEGHKESLPCKLNCKVVSDDCADFILQKLPLSKVFDCRKYPDWDENEDCVNVSKGKCHEEEFQCSDGTCIPMKWVCDKVHDCPGPVPSFDESNCQGCSESEFRCVMDEKCIPLHWKCDGQIDCTDHSDETSC